jgi:hypothetical protein
MAKEARDLHEILAELNDALGPYTSYKLDVVPPGEVQPVEINAHFMAKRIFDQLSRNIAKDRNLSSLPFCWKREDGGYVCLSGNHRVEAAKHAGVERIMILYTDAKLSEAERVAIQLSHNALVGQDNPAILLDLWNRLPQMEFKLYSGLDEKIVGSLEPVKVLPPGEEQLRLESMILLFAPVERERVKDLVQDIQRAGQGTRFVAALEQFDAFFELLLDFKETANVLNSATAFQMMIEIVREWIAQKKQEDDADEGS